MHLNFEWAGRTRKILKITSEGFFLSTWAPQSVRCWQGRRYNGVWGPSHEGWTDYIPISRGLAERILALPSVREGIRRQGAYASWDAAVQLTGFGPIARAVFRAYMEE